jgi:serine/threonine protein kinase
MEPSERAPQVFNECLVEDVDAEYETGPDVVSTGMYGEVHKGRKRATGEDVALKFVRMEGGDEVRRMLLNQVDLLFRLRGHPGILHLMGYAPERSAADNRMVVITKWMENGTLRDIMRKEREAMALAAWTPSKKSMCIFRMVATMKCIHQAGIMHRDIKPESWFLDGQFNPYLGGFGCAVIGQERVEADAGIGSPLYMAPEVFGDSSPDDRHDNKVDVYSFGVTLYQMFTDKVELDDGKGPIRTPQTLMLRVGRGARLTRVPEISDFYWDLIQNCWDQNPERRKSFAEILEHLRSHRSEYAFPGTDVEALERYENEVLTGDEIFVQKQKEKKPVIEDRAPAHIERASVGVERSLSDWITEIGDEYEEFTGKCDRGASGCVKFLRHRVSGEELAVKILKGSDDAQVEKDFLSEINALNALNHPCIVEFKGCCLPVSNEGPKVIMKYYGNGSLHLLLGSDARPIWWTPTRKVMTIVGIVLGMKYIHSKGFIHRDLKPANLLFDDDMNIRVSDFGSSRVLNVEESMTVVGTLQYVAPEVVDGHYNAKVDVYSFGLIVYEIVVGKKVLAPSEMLGRGRPDIPEEVLPFTKSLIEKCWSHAASDRPSFDEIHRMLAEAEFKVIDGADNCAVAAFVNGIAGNKWEESDEACT